MNHNIIQNVTSSVLSLLKSDLKQNGIKGVSCFNRQPDAEKLSKDLPCCIFYLYSIDENQELKEREAYQVRDKGSDGNIHEFLRQPPIKLDLRYLLCAYASDSVVEQQILGRSILVLYDNKELSKQDDLKELIKHPSDKISLRMLPFPHEDQIKFWTALREPMRPAGFYQVTVHMESERQRRFRRVEERILDIHQKE
jgi:Pvc16 N-terminal domain